MSKQNNEMIDLSLDADSEPDTNMTCPTSPHNTKETAIEIESDDDGGGKPPAKRHGRGKQRVALVIYYYYSITYQCHNSIFNILSIYQPLLGGNPMANGSQFVSHPSSHRSIAAGGDGGTSDAAGTIMFAHGVEMVCRSRVCSSSCFHALLTSSISGRMLPRTRGSALNAHF